jgi:hypothetical protein
MNNIFVFVVSFFNRRFELFNQLKNNLFGHSNFLYLPLIIMMCHEEIIVPHNNPCFHLVIDLFAH